MSVCRAPEACRCERCHQAPEPGVSPVGDAMWRLDRAIDRLADEPERPLPPMRDVERVVRHVVTWRTIGRSRIPYESTVVTYRTVKP
jgi:hypothetical protein